MDYLEYKGYKGSVEYSKEDNCLFGKVQGMSKALILYEGQTLDELRKDFEEGIDSYIEGCKADGIEPAKPYSGKLNLRMSSELHSKVAAFVASTGITINDFINKAIRNELKMFAFRFAIKIILGAKIFPSNWGRFSCRKIIRDGMHSKIIYALIE